MAQVALEQGVDPALDYIIPAKLAGRIQIGMRVRSAAGAGEPGQTRVGGGAHGRQRCAAVKNLLGVDDERILISPPVMELARWIGTYYCDAVGVVLESVIPAAVKKKIGIGYSSIVRLAQEPGKIQEVLEKTKAAQAAGGSVAVVAGGEGQGDRVEPIGRVRRACGRRRCGSWWGLGLMTIRAEIDLPKMTENQRGGAGGRGRRWS